MNAIKIRLARQLLGLNQTEFAKLLGWTSKRNIVNLEDESGGKKCTVQTALAIECLLRRSDKFGEFKMLNNMDNRIEEQVRTVRLELKNNTNLTIKITDKVCALDFKEYAKNETWNDNEFNIEFKDSSVVKVSKEDFIKYHFQYTDLALEIEEQYKDYIDELRDAQQEAMDTLQ